MRIEALPERLRPAAVELWRDTGLTRPWNDPAADLARALAGPSSTVLAALGGEDLLGTAMVGHDGHRGWVYYLAVRRTQQRRGIGRALMHACEAWLADRVPKIQLMVRSENREAADFYASLGYERSEVLVLGRWLDETATEPARGGLPSGR